MHDSEKSVLAVALVAIPLAAQERLPVRLIGNTKLDTIDAESDGAAMTVVQAVREASKPGGSRCVVVLRTSGEKLAAVHVDFREMVRTNDTSKNIELQPGDIVYFAPHSLLRRVKPRLARVLEVALRAGLPPAAVKSIWSHADAAIRAAKSPRDRVALHVLFMKHHPSVETRESHVRQLGVLAAEAGLAVPALIRHLGAGSPLVAEAIHALGLIGAPARAALPKLDELARSEDARVRKRAEAAARAIRMAAPVAPVRLVATEMSAAELAMCKMVDRANMRWQFVGVTLYKHRYKKSPRFGGAKFVLDPWIRGLVEHTAQNRDRYFSPTFAAHDLHYEMLVDLDASDLWRDANQVNSRDTHYFGIAADKKRGMWSGKRAWMCTPMYPDGTVQVLYGDGTTKEIVIDEKDRATWTPFALGLTK